MAKALTSPTDDPTLLGTLVGALADAPERLAPGRYRSRHCRRHVHRVLDELTHGSDSRVAFVQLLLLLLLHLE